LTDAEIALPAEGPLVSVIVPTYNRAHTLGDALTSAFAQSYRALQMIVVDDGSDDATPDVVAPFGDRLTYLRTEHAGPGAARNEGMRHATGEFVAWLDSDDVWAPEKVALQVTVAQRYPEAVLVSSDFWAFDDDAVLERSHIATYYGVLRREPGGMAARYGLPTTLCFRLGERSESVAVYAGHVRAALVLGNWIHPPTVLMRRAAAQQAGEIDPSLGNVMEYGFFIRLAALGPFAYLDRPLLGYRVSDEQLSGDHNLLDIRRCVLRTVDELGPDALGVGSRDRARYRRRLADCHLRLAAAAADGQLRREALAHLAASARLGLVDASSLRSLLKVLLPRRAQAAAKRLWASRR
jgi:glycosyltransferase involved in cell wall biosynthesis